MTAPTLATIRRDVVSADQATRGRAMEALLTLARKDESVHAEALGIFTAVVARPPDAWSAVSAARGTEHILGPREGRRAWTTLLNSDQTDIVRAAAQAVDASYAAALIGLLARWNERTPQSAIMNALGRMQSAAAFDPIVARLADKDPVVRANAIVALGLLGDKRAVAHLEKRLADKADAWPEDNHGPMMRVCDVAKETIAKLKAPPGPRPPPAPARPAQRWSPLAYVPFIAAVVEVPWIGAVMFTQLFATGAVTRGIAETQRLDLIAMSPAALGVLAGLAALLFARPRGALATLALIVATAACALFVFSFTAEFLHPE